MPPRPSIPFSSLFSSRTIARALQTTAPLPPPVSPLPPVDLQPQAQAQAQPQASSSKLPPLIRASDTQLPSSAPSAIDLIKSQSTPSTGIYLTARLHSRTYLLHPKDILTLPTLKPLQAPGTTLNLTRILEVGSREYSIRSPAAQGKELRKDMPRGQDGMFETLPDWMVNCQLTVLEHTKSPLEKIVKTKRRKGYRKTIQHKQGWTRLRVGDIFLGKEGEVASS